jgi:thiol:disulfide interchange protein
MFTNFKEFSIEKIAAKYELVFLNFYADWCRFSQILAPVFEEAYANVLKEFPVSYDLLRKSLL